MSVSFENVNVHIFTSICEFLTLQEMVSGLALAKKSVSEKVKNAIRRMKHFNWIGMKTPLQNCNVFSMEKMIHVYIENHTEKGIFPPDFPVAKLQSLCFVEFSDISLDASMKNFCLAFPNCPQLKQFQFKYYAGTPADEWSAVSSIQAEFWDDLEVFTWRPGYYDLPWLFSGYSTGPADDLTGFPANLKKLSIYERKMFKVHNNFVTEYLQRSVSQSLTRLALDCPVPNSDKDYIYNTVYSSIARMASLSDLSLHHSLFDATKLSAIFDKLNLHTFRMSPHNYYMRNLATTTTFEKSIAFLKLSLKMPSLKKIGTIVPCTSGEEVKEFITVFMKLMTELPNLRKLQVFPVKLDVLFKVPDNFTKRVISTILSGKSSVQDVATLPVAALLQKQVNNLKIHERSFFE
eukprot:CAMPEP_0115014882 /NCGR_PEP_ID=MMETSP0216-20121206/26381_1 /TAXON_ID=223996 /ORGANISM="Protocruzia adherens, Strain Boccale" /LENGTH=404 /DNA_ID=CAMNT_0002384783 /DNA_START=52 /DNA_END=1266 /DNA_ORIENTATION=+